MSIGDRIKNFFRSGNLPAAGAGGRLISNKAEPRPAFNVSAPEETVIHRIAELAALVTWESNIEVLLQPQVALTTRDWIKELVFKMLTSEIVSIVGIKSLPRGGGIVTRRYREAMTDIQLILLARKQIFELRVFGNEPQRPAFDMQGADNEFSAGELTWGKVMWRDILQHRARSGYSSNILESMREQDDQVTEAALRLNVTPRAIVLNEDAYLPAETEEKRHTMTQIATDAAKSSNLVVEHGTTVAFPRGAASRAGEANAAYEGALKRWCHFYGLPPSLLHLDLPTHTQLTQSSAYGAFLKNCLIPLLSPVFEAIEKYFAHNAQPVHARIVPDYTHVITETDAERAETGKNLAQTGYWTINELRERDGLAPRPDGDDYPNAAGAPTTKENSNEGGNDGERD